MKALILSIFLLLPLNDDCLKVDIIILADYSGSIFGQEYQIIQGIKTFVDRFELSEEGPKVSLITFGTGSFLEFPFTTNKFLIYDKLHNMGRALGETDMLSAFNLSIQQFGNGRFGYKKVIILISDGMPDNPDAIYLISQMMKDQGISIYGILVAGEYTDEQFMQAVSSVYLKTDYSSLIKDIQKLNICL